VYIDIQKTFYKNEKQKTEILVAILKKPRMWFRVKDFLSVEIRKGVK